MMFVTSHIQQKSADCFEAASCGDLAHAAGQCVSYPGPPCYLSVYVHYALDHCDAGSYLHDEFGSALWECLSWYWSALITCCMQEKDHFVSIICIRTVWLAGLCLTLTSVSHAFSPQVLQL